jgi:hypothetical protein
MKDELERIRKEEIIAFKELSRHPPRGIEENYKKHLDSCHEITVSIRTRKNLPFHFNNFDMCHVIA